MILGLSAGSIFHDYRTARLDLSDEGDLYTATKSIGMVPISKEIYSESVGLVDSSIFYQATVTADEVSWLAQVPEVTQFDSPSHAPLWWRLSLWWHGRDPDMRYFRTNDKWPCVFAYSQRHRLVYGTVEFE